MKPLRPDPARAQLLLRRVTELYVRNLSHRSEPRSWLTEHGLAELHILSTYQLGFSDGRLPEVLAESGAERADLIVLGVLDPNGQETLAGCLVCPVCDQAGQFTTLAGWPVEGPPALRRLPKRPAGLWNAPVLATASAVFLASSILDGLSVTLAGVTNVVAVCGQSAEGVHRQLETSGVRRVILVEGEALPARLRGQRLGAAEYLRITLPGVASVLDFLRQQGPAALARRLTDTAAVNGDKTDLTPLPDGFILKLKTGRYEVRGLAKGPRTLKATLRLERAGRMHLDSLDLYSAWGRRQFVREEARLFEHSIEQAEADLARVVAAAEQRTVQWQSAPPPGLAVLPTESERQEAEALAGNPDLLEVILADFERCGLVGERTNKLLCYLAITSRKLRHPLAVLILASSGAGKSALQEAALAFCPPEDVVKLTTLSGKALFYKERTSLKHKVLALEEGEGIASAGYALRNLISAGELVSEATIRDPASGRLVTMANKVEGPTAVFLTTTNPETDPETKSRFIVTSIDESREQTRAVLAGQRQRHAPGGLNLDTERAAVVRRHWTLQRLLEPVAIVNPFAEQLGFADDRLTSRRDQPKYLRLMDAVALLRQRQKPARQTPGPAPCAYVEVDREDVRVANRIATELFGHTLGELSRPGYELLQLVDRMRRESDRGDGFRFTRRDLREYGGWTHARVHRYLRELLELEYVWVERALGRHHYRLRWDGRGQDGKKFLLGLCDPDRLDAETLQGRCTRPDQA